MYPSANQTVIAQISNDELVKLVGKGAFDAKVASNKDAGYVVTSITSFNVLTGEYSVYMVKPVLN